MGAAQGVRQGRDAGEHGLGAFLGFDGQGDVAGDDDGLADVERAYGGSDAHGLMGVFHLLRGGLGAGLQAAADEQVRIGFVGAFDGVALGFDDAGDLAQEFVVAAAGGGLDGGETVADLGGVKRGEVGAFDVAAHADGLDLFGAEDGEQLQHVAEAQRMAGVGIEGGVGQVCDADDGIGAPGARQVGGDFDGKRAAAGDKGEFRHCHRHVAGCGACGPTSFFWVSVLYSEACAAANGGWTQVHRKQETPPPRA